MIRYGCFESFPFRQNFVISSARSRDFDGMYSTSGVSTWQKLQSICAVLTFDLQLKKIFNIFCKRQILIKLFYLYQRLEYRENYFFKIKFVFFLNLLLSASWKENDLPLYISDIRQILGTEHQYLFSRFHITITYNLPHLQLWNADASTTMKCWRCHNNSVNTGSRLPSVWRQDTKKMERGRNWHDSKQPYWPSMDRNNDRKKEIEPSSTTP